ncbi:MAG TPA: double zinc ribbon domain-containing protein [Gaiellales bacterium]
MLDALLSLIVPRACAGCSAAGPLWCETCVAELEPVGSPSCGRCGAPTRWQLEACRECRGWQPAFDVAWAAVAHRNTGAALVRVWKDRGLDLADVAARVIEERRVPPDVDCLCAVPASGARARRRGVDGPSGLAGALALRWEIPVERDVLTRRRDAPPQRGLSRRERRVNLRDVFACTSGAPARVALIDDVYTTGATADACARALRGAGAEHVEVLTFARALRE